MNASRRDLLRTVPAGVAALALGELGSAQTKVLTGTGSDKKGYDAFQITIDNILSGTTLGTSFSVTGSYSAGYGGKSFEPLKAALTGFAIYCRLQTESGSDIRVKTTQDPDGNYWMADFSGESPGTQLRIVVQLVDTTQSPPTIKATSEVTGITIAGPGDLGFDVAPPPTPPLPTKAVRVSGRVPHQHQAHGTIKSDHVQQIVSEFYLRDGAARGKPIGTRDKRATINDMNMTWQINHRFRNPDNTDIPDDTYVTQVVTAVLFNRETGKFSVHSLSLQDLQIHEPKDKNGGVDQHKKK